MTVEKIVSTLVGIVALGALLAFSLAPVHAASLGQAKGQGMVCELPTGYLKPTGSATADVKAMVNEINAKRKAEYTRIAKENNVQPKDVGILTAKKLQPKCP